MDDILQTRLAEARLTLERSSLARLRPTDDRHARQIDLQSAWNAVAIDLSVLEPEVFGIVPNWWGFLESQFKEESESLRFQVVALQRRYDGLAAIEDQEERRAALAALWKEYTDLEGACESLFGEIVELMGGLALRDRSVDRWLFAVADKLVEWYAQRVNDSWAVTVPRVRGAVARKLISIVGLSFPEWSVWALPLTAHEFARQSFRFSRKAARIKEQIEVALPGVWEGQQISQPEVLYADAFATFTTGPAYLLATIGLRLSPQEAARALVIFRVLERLDDRKKTFHKDFLADFRAQWKDSPVSGSLGREEAERAEHFADAALDALKAYNYDAATYSVVQDWSKAMDVKDVWEENAGKPGKELGVPAQRPLKLIDVLNAAWYCRFKRVADVQRLEVAVRLTCDHLLREQQSTGARSQQQPAAPSISGVSQ
jgi:hypothetical protein